MTTARFLIKIEQILASPPAEVDTKKGNYELQCSALADWFSQDRIWDWKAVVQGSLMVFGWMPTILEVRTRREFVITEKKAADIANLLNEGDAERIDKTFINRSPIGTSKFLHFWRPKLFAIWDTNVCIALTESAREASKVESFDHYTLSIRESAARNKMTLREIEQRLFWFGRNAKS